MATLYEQGLDKILEKIGEETVETILAAKDAQQSGNNENLIYETAALVSSLVMSVIWAKMPRQCKRIARRFGLSGTKKKSK